MKPDTSSIGWPRMRVSMHSPLTASELLAKLRSVTGPEATTFRAALRWETKTLTGHVSEQSFSLRRALQGTHSFHARVVGTVVDEPGGSRLEGVMGIHVAVTIFMIVWFLVTTPLALFALREWLTRGPSMEVALPLAFWSFHLCLLVFIPEARLLRSILRDIAEADANPVRTGNMPTLIR